MCKIHFTLVIIFASIPPVNIFVSKTQVSGFEPADIEPSASVSVFRIEHFIQRFPAYELSACQRPVKGKQVSRAGTDIAGAPRGPEI